jgi:hypothetical protein
MTSGTSYDGDTSAADGFGTPTSVTIADGRPRTVTITNDINGQAIRRDEADNNYTAGDPHEVPPWPASPGGAGLSGRHGTASPGGRWACGEQRHARHRLCELDQHAHLQR